MKKSKYIFTVILGVLIFTYSCELTGSIDDIEPLYKLTEETTYTDAVKCESALNGVYTSWKGLCVFGANTLMLTGNYQPSWGTSGLAENNVSPEEYYLLDYYVDFYKMIQRANFLIKALQSDNAIVGLTAERKLEMEAEARLHRGLAHFYLLRYFGQFYDVNSQLGIVTSTEPILENKSYPRSSVQKTYDIINSDLDYAIAHAPATAEDGFLTKYAAKAMKAKVFLYTKNWTEAASLALEVINSGVYELKDDFRDMYANGYKSKEAIFSPISIGSYGVYAPGSGYNPPGEALKLAAAKSLGNTSGDIESGVGYDPRFAYAHAFLILPPGITNNKYPFSYSVDKQASSHFVLRLGEMYLIYAEAKARAASGIDSDALAKLNAIRTRAGSSLTLYVPASKAELLESIRIEKNLELFGEMNEPWFDMVRYHILGDIKISDSRPLITTNDKLILPFPTEALSGNGGLTQNPGY
jgi:hypothetical protein